MLILYECKAVCPVDLGTLAIVLVIAFGGPDRSASELTVQAFQSPIETPTQPPYPPPATPTLPPYPPPPTPAPSPTPSPACPPQIRWRPFEAEIEVEGLPGAERAMLRVQPVLEEISACLAARGVVLPEMAFGNGRHRLQLQEIPDGAYYKLEVQAPPSFFRDPAGYLFQVQDGQIVHRPGFAFRFRLVPPAEQDLPPCREFEKRFTPPSSEPALNVTDIPADTQKDACRAEGTVDISTPPKQPERPREMGTLSVGYHYVGPMTYQDNQGVWGRNTVVDPNVPHPGPAGARFVAERVYANDTSWNRWMEAGWAEVSWRDDRQYIYEFDTVNNTWIFFDEYSLAPGSRVETDVQYDPNLGMWKARYHLGGGYWRVLMTADIGFTTASQGYNRGEVYTADGVHPILPLSGFDVGYLLINGVWRIWDPRYLTDIARDAPYQCDMIEEYHRFNIHSPIVFIPLVLKDAQ